MKKIIIGITGSIAAYKSVQLISDLLKMSYQIDVIMTESASKFITPLCIESLTKRKVYIDTFDEADVSHITHVDLVKDADLFIIVPASANTIAKVCYGLADNMLTAAFLAATCPKLIAPAMNVNMYKNEATQHNIKILKERNIHFVNPAKGLLACGDIGEGKLADLSDIKEMIDYCLHDKPLAGKNILVSAGPTMEAIDPVRYITNHSSGKMGYELAKAAFCLGANVTLISGQVALKKPYGINVISVTSAEKMYQAIMDHYQKQDIMIMSAAVADYAPLKQSEEKIKKNENQFNLALTKTKDILKELGENKKDHQILCGFAMETVDLVENAKNKLIKKNCDLMIANNLKDKGAGFKTDTNVITMLSKNEIKNYDILTKKDLSYEILFKLIELEKNKKC